MHPRVPKGPIRRNQRVRPDFPLTDAHLLYLRAFDRYLLGKDAEQERARQDMDQALGLMGVRSRRDEPRRREQRIEIP